MALNCKYLGVELKIIQCACVQPLWVLTTIPSLPADEIIDSSLSFGPSSTYMLAFYCRLNFCSRDLGAEHFVHMFATCMFFFD